MTLDEFWLIIEKSREGLDYFEDEQEDKLYDLLLSLSSEEIFSFQQHLDQLVANALSHDLWAAAYIINGGCSDDGFEYFRRALVSAGRENYEKALQDPESLANWVEEGDDVESELFGCVAYDVYEEKTEQDFFEACPYEIDRPAISGEDWDEDDLPEKISQALGQVWELDNIR